MTKIDRCLLSLLLTLLPVSAIFGQPKPVPDTNRVAVPAQPSDSTRTHDSTLVVPRPAHTAAPLAIDTSTAKPAKPPKPRGPRYAFFDSLVTQFASQRLNQRAYLDRSWYHDAGDYFRFSPAFVVRDYQDTPSRKTVQPYGLTGNRMNTVINDLPVNPFEHIVEPDGMVDFDDLPTAWDDGVYIFPGAAGMIFGGTNATGTLLSRPQVAELKRPLSELLVDKGQSGFAFTRGRYAKAFDNGRLVDMAIGYRSTADGWYGANDDASHYNGSIVWPTFANQAVTATGYLYDRRAPLLVQPENWNTDSKAYITRHRFDRYARIGYQFWKPNQPSSWEIGFLHQRQGSFIDEDYRGQFDLTGNGLYVNHDWKKDRTSIRTNLSVDRLKYFDGHDEHSRGAADGSVTIAIPSGATRLAAKAGLRWSESFGAMPQASLVATRESDNLYVIGSIGLAEREPSLHERFLKYQQTSLYPNGDIYADSGNADLKVERQATASLAFEIGKIGRALRLEVTGGRIFNGIDWVHEDQTSSLGRQFFFPRNENINFATVSAQQDFALMDFFKLHAGASYHYVTYNGDRHRPYQPDRNAFAGAELHYFWKSKLIDLWAYGEVVYVGPYDGYYQTDIGNTAVFNATVSFHMGNFRFHILWQNPLLTEYRSREFYVDQSNLVSYGFTWNFFD